MKIDLIKVQNDVMTWKQIERKAGLIFMRIIKRGKKVWLKNDR